jgi:hypothetical protein
MMVCHLDYLGTDTSQGKITGSGKPFASNHYRIILVFPSFTDQAPGAAGRAVNDFRRNVFGWDVIFTSISFIFKKVASISFLCLPCP